MLKTLKQISLLSDVDPELLEKHVSANHINVGNYKKGCTLHCQNDECSFLDFVLSGSLVAYSLAESGSAANIFEFNKNSIIGANLLFGDNRKYPLNIYCLSDCTLVHISTEAVSDFLRCYDFVMKFVRSLSKNSQGMNQKIAMFTQKNLKENILDYLYQLSIQQNSETVVIPISKRQLADYFGVQRPSLFRAMKNLKDEGFLKINNREIVILKSGNTFAPKKRSSGNF